MMPPAPSPSSVYPVTLLTDSAAPEGPDVGEDLRGVREEIAKEHRHAVEGVVLGRHQVRLAGTGPVEVRVGDRLEEVAVGKVVRPLTLPLETRKDGVVPGGFLAEAPDRPASGFRA